MVNIKKIFNRLFKKRVKPVFYDEIGETPMNVWIEIHDKGTIKPLLIKGQTTTKELKKAWHNINNQYLKKHGLTKEVKRMMNKKKRLVIAMNKFIYSGDYKYEMEADLLRAELKDLQSDKEENTDFNRLTASLEKYFGFQIDTGITSIDKYYNYVGMLKDQALRNNLK